MSENTTTKNKRRSKNSGFLFTKEGYFDYQIFFIVMVITLFGVMMVYSASSYRAVMEGNSDYYYAARQIVFAVVGTIAMLAVSVINYKTFKKLSVLILYIAAFLCLIVVFIGTASNGAVRWINLGFFQLQPSELLKPAIIIYMAHKCVAQPKLFNSIQGLIKMMAIPGVAIIIVGMENLSTAIVCFAIAVIIIFVATPNVRPLVILGLIGVGVAAIGVFAASYRGGRFDAWLNPETSENGYQTMQSLYAIGSGGIFGKGLGNSIQKTGFLPESHNDMIFSIVCEELGLFGAIAVIVLFVMLLFRMRYIANNSPDAFAGLMVTGVLAHIAIQMMINIGVVTNTIPNTGVTLPFISYGGTSLIAMLAEVGLVLSVSRQLEPYEK